MLIYILHSDKIYTFRLPRVITGSYVLTDCDAEGHTRNLVNIQAIDNKWFINSNEEVVVNYNGQDTNQIQLVEYNTYILKLFKNENVLLYIYPGNETNYAIKNVIPGSSLIVGNDNSCDIVFTSKNIASKQVEISYVNGVWKYKNLNSSIPVFVNMKNKQEAILSNLDSLFIMGLKIIVMGEKLIIITVPNMVYILLNKLAEETRVYNMADICVEENIKDFYNPGDYFLKSPVFRKKYDDYNVIITSPASKEKGESNSFLSQVIPSALMSVTSLVSTYFAIQNYKAGQTDRESLITNLLMCGLMLLTGIVWPIIEMFASKIRALIAERVRVFNYRKYLKRKRKELTDVIRGEKLTLEFNNLSLVECQEAIKNKNAYLFSRNIDSPSFLTLRFGTGRILSSIHFQYTRPDLIVENDKLLNEIDKVIEQFKYIDDAPFTLSLKEYSSVALINVTSNFDEYLKSLILQLVTFHDYKSLKLVVFTDESSELCNIKNLNHCWNDERSFRYFASNINEAESVSSHLVRIFNRCLNTDNNSEMKDYSTHYLIITDSIKQYKNLKIIDHVIRSKENKCFSIIMFSSKIVDIPLGCNAFIEYNDESASFFQSEMDENSIVKFKPEFIDSSISFMRCIDLLSNIPISLHDETQGSLPTKLGFLEMYNVGNLEQLNIISRWKQSSIVNSLAAPIGVDSNGNTLYLDLHEKKHGPHGLIAGMTGSGKSEFIVTYILSLAINYNPNEVQFVLIDYKGGGLAGAFENRKTGVKLPHLVGTITNLDKSEMSRTLVSIKSELQRRQRKFNEAKEALDTGTIDIYKYQSLVRDGSLKEPMSHLFIICDEFAELKSQQPDFMDELVSAARIGRSLGIHLILATQKPSGVVDDQIWANSKFKVCCKVQTAEDSNEMIRKPDAAFLKDSGRFYLQVGYDEYFVLGQSGYSGFQYVPTEKVVSKIDDSVAFVNNIGDVYKNVVKKEDTTMEKSKSKLGEELNNILKYIVDIANENGYTYHQLWLENVPKLLLYNDLMKKYDSLKALPFDINPLIGEYDAPKKQAQGFVTLPLTNEGNALILGATGMGKTTLLSTIIYSTIISHGSEEVNFYIIDLGTEKLKKFSKAPQVGEVLGANDRQKIGYLFYMIESEISKRQKYYSEHGTDFILDVKNKRSVFPNMIVIIHGMEAFRESFEDIFDEKFSSIVRSCSKYGINFIITGLSPSAINYVVENNFNQKIMLNLNDPSDYATYFSNSIIPSKNPGRGLIEIDSECVEFQASLIFEEENEKQNLNYVINKLIQIFPNKAKGVPTVPKHLGYAEIKPLITTLSDVPMGINILSAQYEYYNFTSKVSLLGASKSDVLKKFIPNFVKTLSLCDKNKIIVLNTLDNLEIKVDESVKYYDSNFKNVFPILESNILKMNSTSSQNTFTIVILGYSKLNSHMLALKAEDDSILSLDELILSSTNDNFKFILYDNANSFNNIMSGNLSELVDNQEGIWVGSDYEMQECFDTERVYPIPSLPNDSIALIKDSYPSFVKYPSML